MDYDEQTYWRARAEAELQLSRSASDDRVIRAHALLAGYYFDRAFRPPGDAFDTRCDLWNNRKPLRAAAPLAPAPLRPKHDALH